ncbi:MAG: hypothetical protein ACKOAU_07135 [Pirellula sp.]
MPKITMLFGALLVGISLIILAITQKVGSPSIFIPAVVGIPLLVLGYLSQAIPTKRKLFMHIAVTVGLLGALASIVPIGLQLSKIARGEVLDPLRAGSVFSMAILCGIYEFLCVKSFIKARKSEGSNESV